MFEFISDAKNRLSDVQANRNFITSLDYVFKGLVVTGLGIWIASVLNIMFIPPLLNLLISIALLFAISRYASEDNVKATPLYYLFTFWTGLSLYGLLYSFSLILTPQVVISTVMMTLMMCAVMITLSLIVFSYRSNAKLAEQYMSSVYYYGFFVIVGLIIFGCLASSANIATFMFVDGLVTTGLFSVYLMLDTFKAAYMVEDAPHPILTAITIYLDILNIVIGVLEVLASSEIDDDLASSGFQKVFQALVGVLMPITLGAYLVYDAFFGKRDDGDFGAVYNDGSGAAGSNSITRAQAYYTGKSDAPVVTVDSSQYDGSLMLGTT
ncbi:MAG: Bax inhibitor-1 family protein [Gammaproteobacteria bacterium]|nr:Bax inhibitor-1 family protein [Gammaproteobacteria bacterium]